MGRPPSLPRTLNVFLTFSIFVSCFLGTNCQEKTAESWDKLSQLIPTNSVYEHRDRNASPSSTNSGNPLLRFPEENNVMDSSKADTNKNINTEENEETYEDEYQTETEPETISRNTKLSKITNEAKKNESFSKHPSVSEVETEDTSRDEDYLEDPSTSQYDAYYYYDDYENSNRSQYRAIDAEALDYPDTEEEVSYIEAGQSKHNSSKIADKVSKSTHSSLTTDNSSLDEFSHLKKKEFDSTNSASNFEEGSSMEGSDKTFTFLGAPAKSTADVSGDSSILIGEAVVSVVTTKSVVNGTISVPTTSLPSTTEQIMAPPSSSIGTTEKPVLEVTTEDSSRILASVQTSRSISGARFLPFPVIDRVEPIDQSDTIEKKTSPPPESTESIIDKLDRVQSELSSGFLVGGFRTAGNTLQLDVLSERERNARRRFTTTAKTPIISKFVPRRYNDKRLDHTNTTPRPRLETTLDNLDSLLPRDFVARGTTSGVAKIGFRWPSSKSTTSEAPEVKALTTFTTTPVSSKRTKTNVALQDVSAFLPPNYKLKNEDSQIADSSILTDILAKSNINISSLLPSDYNKKNDKNSVGTNNSSTPTAIMGTSTEKSTGGKSIQDLFAKSSFDISALLPRDYEQKKKNLSSEVKEMEMRKENSSAESVASTGTEYFDVTTKKPGGLKIVFPSRPGGRKPIHKITTPHTPRSEGSAPVTPKIQKGWPTRATTEFTGWPTPSTTPISIEKLLEAARTATVASVNASLIPITNVVSSTSTTSTTTTTLRPTTPGICEEECEVAGTIRIIGNAVWVPELLDRNTQEWQKLANEVEREMNFIFSKSAILANWYKKIRIDSFSQGSILVDYFVEFTNLQQKINTQELKVIFHDSLRTYNANSWNDTKAKNSMKLGTFTIDPKYTDFIVIPKVTAPQYIEKDDRLIPQWAIAVIVIGVGGLVFIIIFGVSVLVNRQNGSKLKPSVSAIYEEEVAKNITSHRSSDCSKPVHTIWTDPDVSWNDKSFESTSNKVLVEKPFQDNKKYNLYDSWRSEWNGYYYNPSHASSKYGGYDSTTNSSSRHHPDYDTNF